MCRNRKHSKGQIGKGPGISAANPHNSIVRVIATLVTGFNNLSECSPRRDGEDIRSRVCDGETMQKGVCRMENIIRLFVT